MPDIKTLKEIRDAMLKHFDDDKDSFGEITHKLEAHEHLFQDIMKSIESIDKKMDKLVNDSEPVNEWFRNASYLKTTMIWVIGLVGSIIAITIGIRNLFER